MKNITMWDAIEIDNNKTLDEWKKLSDTDKAIHKLQYTELYKKIKEINNAK